MDGLFKIGDISQKLNITTRTLRYYEETGLIKSTRDDENQYRYYDSGTIEKIKRIITLRNLTFSIKEIQQILSSGNYGDVITIFKDKLKALREDLTTKSELIDTLEKIISMINVNNGKLMEEDIFIGENNMDMLHMENEVRVIKLRPMRVAYYTAVSESPEDDAWNVMRKWVKENTLDELFTTRYFGFNNPDPSPGNSIYGYEVWVTVTPEIQDDDNIGIKEFRGGLYAVVSCNMQDIVKKWTLLYSYIEKSHSYKIAKHQWLEEHLILNDSSWPSHMQVDLYCPIEII